LLFWVLAARGGADLNDGVVCVQADRITVDLRAEAVDPGLGRAKDAVSA